MSSWSCSVKIRPLRRCGVKGDGASSVELSSPATFSRRLDQASVPVPTIAVKEQL